MTCTTALTVAMLATTALSGPAAAREPTTDAEALIARALQLRRAGRPVDALDLFRKAHEQAPSPRTLGHMGLVETSLQLWSDADAHLAAALATPADRWVQQNQTFLADARARTEPHVGQLVVTGPPGARLSVAGRELGRLPLRAPLRLAEGDVRITATAEGTRPFSVQLNIQGGTRAAVTVVLEPVNLEAPAPLPPPVVAADTGWHLDRRKWIAAALTGAGAGALALGIVWLQMDGRCDTAVGNFGRCVSAYDSGRLGWVATAGGAVMLLAGGAVWIVSSRPATSVGLAAAPRAIRLEARF